MASRILGMGDMLTLIEKATQTVDEKDAKKLAEKMQEKGFDLNDLLEQMKQIQKMGSMKSIIRMLPGANKVTDEQVEQGEVQLKKTEAMINSMTRTEREKPAIIDPKRKRRIAAGSGTQVSDVNQLLKHAENDEAVRYRRKSSRKEIQKKQSGTFQRTWRRNATIVDKLSAIK